MNLNESSAVCEAVTQAAEASALASLIFWAVTASTVEASMYPLPAQYTSTLMLEATDRIELIAQQSSNHPVPLGLIQKKQGLC